LDNWISLGDLLKPGVYALMWRGKFTYIGKSKCLLVALAAHRAVLSGPRLPEWFPTKRVQFDDIKIIPCAADRAARLLPALIDMHKPQHNLHVRPALPLPTFQAPDRPAPTITRRI
jgi:hypothetical protein